MKKFWKGLGSAVGYTALFLGIQLWVTLVAVCLILGNIFKEMSWDILVDTNVFVSVYMDILMENLTGIVLISNLFSIGLVFLIFYLRGKHTCREIDLKKIRPVNLLLAVMFGIGLCYTSNLISNLLPIPESMMDQFAAEHGMLFQGNVFLTFFSVAFVGPIAEEIFFRGLNYTRLRRGMKPIWAGVISAVIFGLVHGNPVWFIVAFLAGMGMAWIFETTGSLWATIAVHIINNTLATISVYYPTSALVDLICSIVGVLLLVLSVILLILVNRKPAAAPAAIPAPEFYNPEA